MGRNYRMYTWNGYPHFLKFHIAVQFASGIQTGTFAQREIAKHFTVTK